MAHQLEFSHFGAILRKIDIPFLKWKALFMYVIYLVYELQWYVNKLLQWTINNQKHIHTRPETSEMHQT